MDELSGEVSDDDSYVTADEESSDDGERNANLGRFWNEFGDEVRPTTRHR